MSTTNAHDPVFHPINAKVILRLLPEDDRTPGGLFIPERHRQRANRAVVVAVGPGREYPNGQRIPPGVEPGDEVYFTRYADERDLFGKFGARADLVAVSQEEILCVVERDPADAAFAESERPAT